MKWKKQDKTQWHRVFAWHPVTTVCDTVVWLEYVEFRDKRYSIIDKYGLPQSWPAEYRLIEEEKQ
jgi:hypothetical protein